MNDEEFELYREFMTDDEINEMIDSSVLELAKILEEEDNRTSIINPKRVEDVIYTYKLLKNAMKSYKNVTVDYELHEPFRSSGYVSVAGKKIEFKNSMSFLKAMQLANNFEAIPKMNGNVEINFMFYNLTTPLE